jgi:hypothetical protein
MTADRGAHVSPTAVGKTLIKERNLSERSLRPMLGRLSPRRRLEGGARAHRSPFEVLENVDSLDGIEPNRARCRMQGMHRPPVIGCHVLTALASVLAITARIAPVSAEERIPVLTRMLASGSDKTRLSAVQSSVWRSPTTTA